MHSPTTVQSITSFLAVQTPTVLPPSQTSFKNVSGMHQNFYSNTVQISPNPSRSPSNNVVIQQSRPKVESPFWIAFIFGNVSRCNGCKGKLKHHQDNTPLPPPDDLILGHKEFVIYINPKTGRFEQSWDKRNVYYHLRNTCVAPNFLDFNPLLHIKINNDV